MIRNVAAGRRCIVVRCRIVVARHVVGARGTAGGRRIVVARGAVRGIWHRRGDVLTSGHVATCPYGIIRNVAAGRRCIVGGCGIVVARCVVGVHGTAVGRRIVVARGVVRAHATIGGCSDVGARCYVPRCYVPLRSLIRIDKTHDPRCKTSDVIWSMPHPTTLTIDDIPYLISS